MSDLEIQRLCAEAMALTLLPVLPYPASENEGKPPIAFEVMMANGIQRERYDPLTNDVQMVALVKRFSPMMVPSLHDMGVVWTVTLPTHQAQNYSDLNRAVCECVAKTQEAKTSTYADAMSKKDRESSHGGSGHPSHDMSPRGGTLRPGS